jgi:hypothetical protein
MYLKQELLVMLKSKVETQYLTHDCTRISQGDILRGFTFVMVGKGGAQIEVKFQYIVVFSQDCDLEHGTKVIELLKKAQGAEVVFNQYLHNILFIPAFPAEQMREGNHLPQLYNIKSDRIASDLWKPIKKNENARYHFLPACPNLQIPELMLDFKAYYTLPFEGFLESYESQYLATINELFRENLSQRFANYLNRIGLPEKAV